MQGYGEVAALVGDSVKSQLIGHIGHSIFLICLLRDDLHGSLFFVLLGKREASLGQITSQDLHQAMGVAVVVDRTSLTRGPDEYELYMSISQERVLNRSPVTDAPSYSCRCLHRQGCGYSPGCGHQRHTWPNIGRSHHSLA